MTDRRVSTRANKLKVKIPFAFEAQGEGLAPILCLAGLCALFMIFGLFRLSLAGLSAPLPNVSTKGFLNFGAKSVPQEAVCTWV
jgi:hypothetical protein